MKSNSINKEGRKNDIPCFQNLKNRMPPPPRMRAYHQTSQHASVFNKEQEERKKEENMPSQWHAGCLLTCAFGLFRVFGAAEGIGFFMF